MNPAQQTGDINPAWSAIYECGARGPAGPQGEPGQADPYDSSALPISDTADGGDRLTVSHGDHVHDLPTDNTLEFFSSGQLGISNHFVSTSIDPITEGYRNALNFHETEVVNAAGLAQILGAPPRLQGLLIHIVVPFSSTIQGSQYNFQRGEVWYLAPLQRVPILMVPVAGTYLGNIEVEPGNIAAAADLDGTYQITLSDLPVTTLITNGVNYLEIWFGTEAVHVVTPWTPSETALIDAVVDTTEETAIGLTNQDNIRVLAVFRHNAGGDQAFRGQVGTTLTIGGSDRVGALETAIESVGSIFVSPSSVRANDDTPPTFNFTVYAPSTNGATHYRVVMAGDYGPIRPLPQYFTVTGLQESFVPTQANWTKYQDNASPNIEGVGIILTNSAGRDVLGQFNVDIAVLPSLAADGTINPARFEQSISASGSTLRAGAHSVTFVVTVGTGGSARLHSKTFLVSTLGSTAQVWVVSQTNPTAPVNNRDINLSLAYNSTTRALTYSLASTVASTSISSVTAVGG